MIQKRKLLNLLDFNGKMVLMEMWRLVMKFVESKIFAIFILDIMNRKLNVWKLKWEEIRLFSTWFRLCQSLGLRLPKEKILLLFNEILLFKYLSIK